MTRKHNHNEDEYSNRVKQARISNTREHDKTDASNVWTFTQGPLDSTFGQHAAFPVVQWDENTDYITDSVLSYMGAVRQEAEKDRSIHYVDRPQYQATEYNEDKTTESNKIEPDILNPISNGNVNHAWKKELMAEFLQLKTEVEIYLQTLKRQLLVPENTVQDNTTDTPVDVPETATEWRQYIINNPPPSIKFFFESLNRPTIIKLLIYATKWLNANVNENLSKWIFRLFLRLDNLLDHVDCSIVRDLAKKAIKVKTNTSPQDINDVSKYTIDMIIFIVGEYYRQRDLLVY